MRVSQFYKLGKTQPSLPFLDVDIQNDVKLFVNPRAINNLDSEWADHCKDIMKGFFKELLSATKAGKNARVLELLSRLKEPNETHLGLSEGESDGRGLGPEKAKQIARSFQRSKAVRSGLLTDLEDTVLLIDGISTDILSDIITNTIRGPLISFTQKMCEAYDIPMEAEVDSGPVWNLKTKKWENDFVSLPMPKGNKLILVPKSIVRLEMSYSVSQYYRHYVLEALREEEIAANSGLVHILRTGKKKGQKKVYKTDLMAKYGKEEKSVSIAQTERNPEILKKYKAANANPTPALTHGEIAAAEGTPPPDWAKLLNDVIHLTPGKKDAYKYEEAVQNLLYALFWPVLVDPDTQTPVHDGLKRVDITFTNYAQSGFFNWVARHYPSPYVFVECKNFGEELGNPEVDQIAMRMADRRGRFGMIVCRTIEDRQKMLKRCQAAARDGHGYIVALDDNDLRQLIKEATVVFPPTFEFPTLKKYFKQLVF